MRTLSRFLTVGLTVLLLASPVLAGPIIDAVKAPIDKGLELLKDPRYSAADMKQAQRDEMWKIIREAFDFAEISKRAVARDWRRFTPQEKKAFTEAFETLLGNTYIKRIQDAYQGEEVKYLGEESLSDTKARVRTVVPRESGEMLIDYSVILIDGRWRVYDVIVEGVSLVKNYRTQFRRILAKQSPADLINRVKEKATQQND